MPNRRPRRVVVHDRMQSGYAYELTEPEGRNFHPLFQPELTPAEMLALGVFGGCYLTDCGAEFPKAWFKGARLSPGRSDARMNYFRVLASQPLAEWRRKGWIHPDDPRGWFQWYCRYYLGRRHPDDERQVRRWRAARRHMAQVRRNCRRGDPTCRPRQKQALLHWAYDARKL